MNPTNPPFPNSQPPLKLTRREEAAADDGDPTPSEIAADLAALREREANLREYEERLRAWQARLDAATMTGSVAPVATATQVPLVRPTSLPPFQNDPALNAAWEKLYRARALLEAEQRQMRDDRIAVREARATLDRREESLAAREARLQEREAQLLVAAAEKSEPAAEPEKPRSAIQRLTQVPWAVFKGSK